MTESTIVVRIPTAATSAKPRSGPPIAPALSIARSSPYARPYASGGATSASSALRAGPRTPRATQPAIRSKPACHTAVASPIAAVRIAVAVYPPTAVVLRRSGSSASAPPPSLATPPSPSASPSITPSAAAGAPSVLVRKAGSRAVGTSWPRSASRLAPPIATTPRFSQGRSASADCERDLRPSCPDRAGPRALSEHLARPRRSRSYAADAADHAVRMPDPVPRDREPHSDHARHLAFDRRRGRRRRRPLRVVEEDVREPFVSPGTRFVASDSKTASRPSALSAGRTLSPFASTPLLPTLMRLVAPLRWSWTKTSVAPFVSPGTRFDASE